ncbi:metallophosphoesterase family protein, partial [Massilia glaciei]
LAHDAGAAQAAGPGHVVYAAGDIASCHGRDARHSGAAATADLVAGRLAHEPRARVLLLGDIVYGGGTEALFNTCFGPTWGRFKERTHPAPGNHEYISPGARGYFDYFGAAAGPGHYSLALGNWRLYSLDSNLAGPAKAAQLDWLRAELARDPSRCTLAFWHHPLYSSGVHGSLGAMRAEWELLHRHGAEIVLSAHDHDYERFAPQDAHGKLDRTRGVRQFVAGMGGAYRTPFLLPLANSERRDASRTGVLRLRLRDDGYEWELLEASYDGFPHGPEPDQGKGSCH